MVAGVTARPGFGVVAAALALALATSSCFFDSRWGEKKRVQQSNARHATPGALRATPAETPEGAPTAGPPLRVLKVRAHATPSYAAEVVGWPQHFAEMVSDANLVLGPTLRVRLEVAAAEAWSPRAADDDLSVLLDELAQTDPGTDVDRVVGLAGSVPQFELSFTKLGMARTPGKHFVVRTMNSAREYENVERSFSELGEQERQKLFRARKRHKTAVGFLHELGHSLGVPHEVDAHTIMHPKFDRKADAFSPAAADLMRLNLAHQLDPSSMTEQAFAESALGLIQKSSAGWVPADRDVQIARLEHLRAAAAPRPPPRPTTAARAAPASSAPAPSPSPTDKPHARPKKGSAAVEAPPASDFMVASDRALLEKARAELRAGRAEEAWTTAKPLFATYPDDYAVQDLRCQLAMKRGVAWQEVQSECDRLMHLVPGGGAR